jgi:hypothetical protein
MHSHFGWEVTDAPGAIGGSTDFVCVISTSGLHLITLQGNVTYGRESGLLVTESEVS